MRIRSLGYFTDLLFPRFDAEVVDKGRYTVIRTTSNPSYYWGNFVLFDRPPLEGDLEKWQQTFAQEIGTPPQFGHIALGWDSPEGDHGSAKEFTDAGFHLDESIVLAAKSVQRPEKYCEDVAVRPLEEEWEWDAALDLHVLSRDEIHDEASYRVFAGRQLARHRAMAAAGIGTRLGAFLDGELAGDLGLFVFEGVGRFQNVATHPDFRRRGVCGALVHQAAQFGFDTLGAETLVMVADAHYHAAKIYESVGFVPTERQVGLCKWTS